MPSTYSGQGSFSGVGSLKNKAVYTIGQTGPAGGKIFYDAGSTLSWGQYLECAPAPAGASNFSDTTGTWSGNTNTLVGTSSAIGTGYTNTLAIVAQNNTASKAGTYCDAYEVNGFTDWFLPSRDELTPFIANRASYSPVAGNAYYWSSTESSATNAYGRYSSGEASTAKSGTWYIRPIRYVE
jgi:hypothetical protein